MKRNLFSIMLASILIIALMGGCGSNVANAPASQPDQKAANPTPAQPAKPPEPVTLTVITNGVVITDGDFQKLFVEPVKKKYPYVTLSMIKSGTNINQLIAANEIPDLFLLNTRSYAGFGNLKVTSDLNDLVKKYNLDLSRFEPTAIDVIHTLGDGKQLFGIPFYQNLYALYYNKDIFDKFGVAYPKDGMTWDQSIELARKLTRVDGEVQYKGLSASWTGQGVRDFASGFALPYIDPKTMKATVNTDGWKKALTILKEINDIPGNLGGDVRNYFNKDKILAMMVSANPRIGELEELYKKGEGVNYDFAAPPYFPELPGKTQETDTRFIAVSGTSKNRDLAFQVVQEIVSDANAVEFSRRAFPPVLKNADLQKQFGAEMETLKGKHIEAFFKSKPIVSPIRTKYVNDADKAVQTEFTKVLQGQEDINTALRNADEAINKLVEAGEK